MTMILKQIQLENQKDHQDLTFGSVKNCDVLIAIFYKGIFLLQSVFVFFIDCISLLRWYSNHFPYLSKLICCVFNKEKVIIGIYYDGRDDNS